MKWFTSRVTEDMLREEGQLTVSILERIYGERGYGEKIGLGRMN